VRTQRLQSNLKQSFVVEKLLQLDPQTRILDLARCNRVINHCNRFSSTPDGRFNYTHEVNTFKERMRLTSAHIFSDVPLDRDDDDYNPFV